MNNMKLIDLYEIIFKTGTNLQYLYKFIVMIKVL